MRTKKEPIRIDYADGSWKWLGPAHPIQVPCKEHGKKRGQPCWGEMEKRTGAFCEKRERLAKP